MRSIAHDISETQHMDKLPDGQDVIAVDRLGWTGRGPLPTAELEHIAWSLFLLDHADWQWDQVTSAVRDDYRGRALTIRAKVLKVERWNLGNAVEKCAASMGQLVAGDRGLFPAEKKQLHDYAESCIQDLFGLFMGDNKAKSEDWRHKPEDEPDDSELDDLGPTPTADPKPN